MVVENIHHRFDHVYHKQLDTGVFAITSPIIVSSNNYNNNYATVGNQIQVEFSASRPIVGLPTVLIAGQTAKFINSIGPRYAASINVTAASTEGLASLLIFGYTDEERQSLHCGRRLFCVYR